MLCQLTPGATSTSLTSSVPFQPRRQNQTATADVLQPDTTTDVNKKDDDSKTTGSYTEQAQKSLEGMEPATRRVWVISLSVIIVLVISLHRLCPLGFRKLDLLFAGDHFIDHTHAKRMFDTRLGAAFTVSLPFALAIAAIQTFGSNNLLVSDGLVPATTLRKELSTRNESLFKTLNVTMHTYAASAAVPCSGIVPNFAKAIGLTCTHLAKKVPWSQNMAATRCTLDMKCRIGNDFRGTSIIDVSFPDLFQNIQWKVMTPGWEEHDRVKADLRAEGLESSFGPTTNATLAGDREKPTELLFGVVRSRFISTFKKTEETATKSYGVQLS